jgi:transcriptional regulator with XRE-family HTH domain
MMEAAATGSRSPNHTCMPHHTSVRRNRLRWALSQAELAELLGVSQSIVSRVEAGDTVPDLQVSLSLQVVFGQSPRALFPALYGAVENRVMANAAELDRTLGAKRDHASEAKRRLLTGMAHRAGGNHRAA